MLTKNHSNFMMLLMMLLDWYTNDIQLFIKKLVFLYSLTLFGFILIDVFSQMSDSNGLMIFSKFDQFLKEVLKLPTAVFEGPSFGYTEHSGPHWLPTAGKGQLIERRT